MASTVFWKSVVDSWERGRAALTAAHEGVSPSRPGRTTPYGFLVLLTALLLVALAAPAQTTSGQSRWTTPYPVSESNGGDWFPDLAVNAAGTVYVIWGSGQQRVDQRSGIKTDDDLLRYRELRGQTWSPVNDIVATCVGGYTVRNSLAVGPDGQLHVLVRTCVRVSSLNAPADAAWSAQHWSRPLSLGESYYSALAVDQHGTLHAVYNEAIPYSQSKANLASEIMYRRSVDGGQTWTVRTNLAQLPDGDERMQILVDQHDRVHVVWDHGSDWYLGIYAPEYSVYRRSDDGGLTWREQTHFQLANTPVFQVSLGLDRAGNPFVVYRSALDDSLYFQHSLDGGDTWSDPAVIPYVRARPPRESALDRYTLATDSLNHLHLLVAGFLNDSLSLRPQLLHLTWDGQTWSPPEVVAADATFPFWPRLVISGGNQLHAVWFSYTQQSGWGDRNVWYSTQTLDIPRDEATPTLAVTASPEAPAEQTQVPEAALVLLPTPTVPRTFRTLPPPPSTSLLPAPLVGVGVVVGGLLLGVLTEIARKAQEL